MKTCKKCKLNLEVSSFDKSKLKKDGLQPSCKDCRKIEYHQRKSRGVTVIITSKICSTCNLEKGCQNFYKTPVSKDGFQSSCKDCIKIRENTPETKEKRKNYNQAYKTKIDHKKQYAIRKAKNPEKLKQYRIEYQNKNREKINAYKRSEKYKLWRKNYRKLRMSTDSIFKLNSNMSRGIFKSLKYATVKKSRRHWENLVNFDRHKLKAHLESMFKTGMTWENYGKWHIDHIRPVKSFNITGPDCEDFKKCWSMENLQPLWAHENLTKHGKWEPLATTDTTA